MQKKLCYPPMSRRDYCVAGDGVSDVSLELLGSGRVPITN